MLPFDANVVTNEQKRQEMCNSAIYMSLDLLVLFLCSYSAFGDFKLTEEEKQQKNLMQCFKYLDWWIAFQIPFSVFSLLMHCWHIKNLRQGYTRNRTIRRLIEIEVILFFWLVMGYYFFFSQGCPSYTNEREKLFSDSLLMQDVRVLRAITIAVFIALCGPCFLIEYLSRRRRRETPNKLFKYLTEVKIRKLVP